MATGPLFNDNVFLPRDVNGLTTLVNEALADGFVSFWARMHALSPTTKIIGNIGAGLNEPKFNQQLEGGTLECTMGKN